MNKALDVSAAFSSNMIGAALSAWAVILSDNHKLNGVRLSSAPGWKTFKEKSKALQGSGLWFSR